MGNDKPNNEEGPAPVSSPVQKNDKYTLTVNQNESADCSGKFHNGNNAEVDSMSFQSIPPPVAPSPWNIMDEAYQSCSTFDNLDTNGNLMIAHVTSDPLDIRNIIDGSLLQDHYEGNMDELCLQQTYDDGVTADYALNTSTDNSIQSLQVNGDFRLIGGDAARSYQMTRHGGETSSTNSHGPHIKGKFISLGGNTPKSSLNQNSRETNNARVSAVQFGSPEKINGCFLTLGTGRNTQSMSTFDLNTISKLNEVASSQSSASHIQQTTGDSLNLDHNLASGFSGFQNNADGFSSWAQKAGGRTSSKSNGIMCGTTTDLRSSSSCILQRPQVSKQPDLPVTRNMNLGLSSSRCASYTNSGLCNEFLGDLASYTRPSTCSSTGLPDVRIPRLAGLASEAAKDTAPQLGCLAVSPFVGISASSTMRDRSGQLFSAYDSSTAQAMGDSMFSQRTGVQIIECAAARAASCGLLSQQLGFQVTESEATQIAGNSALPLTSGVQFTELSAECGLHRGGMRVRPASKLGKHHGRVFVQHGDKFLEPTSSRGQSRDSVPFQFPIRFPGSSLDFGAPAHFPNNFHGPASTMAHFPGSNALGGPSRKRSAGEPLPNVTGVRREKTTLQSSLHPSMKSPHQPASVSYYIKRQAVNVPPQPTGQRCSLCKRDLSFTAEGPVYQPTVPPAVAVLPCGHTFHEHCLLNITPKDESKDPPCIPCALGET